MTFGLDIWQADSSSPYLGQVRRSRSQWKLYWTTGVIRHGEWTATSMASEVTTV